MANKKEKVKREKYNGLKGYRLHLARFKFSSKRGMRTIKFPLGEWDTKNKKIVLGEKEKEFAEKVKSDYENLYGPLSLTAYKDVRDKNRKKIYSLKDFWVDSLRAGVVFATSNGKMKTLISDPKYRDQLESTKDGKRLLSCLKEENIDSFIKEFLSSPIRWGKVSGTTDGEKKRKKQDKFLKFCRDTEGSKKESEKLFAELLGTSEGQQKGVWKNMYGIEVNFREKGKKVKQYPYAFYITPDIEFEKDEEDVEKLIKRYDEYAKGKEKILNRFDDVKKGDAPLLYVLGVSGERQGFSNYFNFEFTELSNEEGVQKIFECVKNASNNNEWIRKENDLRERLGFLSDKAKLLERPGLVNGWHEYRSDIGGKIQSWISNTFRQDEEIKKQLFGSITKKWDKKRGKEIAVERKGHTQELQKIKEVIGEWKQSDQSEKNKGDFERDKMEVSALVLQMENQLESVRSYESEGRIPIDELQVYGDLLADFRTKFNFFFQEVHGYQDDESKKIKDVKKEYPALFKELKTPPSFIGDVKMAKGGVYDKYFSSLGRLRAGIDFLKQIDVGGNKETKNTDIEKDVEKIRRSLQSVVRMYQDAQSVVGKQICEKALKLFDFNPDDFIERDKEKKGKGTDKNFNHVWRNKNAREKKGKNFGNAVKDESYIKNKDKLLAMIKPDWDKHKKLNINTWLDLVALEKVRIGLLAYFYDIGSVKLPKNKEFSNHYPKASVIEKRFKTKDSDASNTIIQAGVLSEMRGTLSKMSTGEMIMRYVAQPMESEKKFPVISIPQDGGERYFISPKSKGDIKKETKGKESNARMLSDKKKEAIPVNFEDVFVEGKELFEVQSSRVQMQFLNKSFSGFWEEYKPTLASHSFIFEEIVDVRWSDDGCEIKPKKDLNGKDKRKLFVSIPFEIGYDTSDERNNMLDKRNRFLGVDIGEYGIATYLLNAEDMKKSTHKSFVYEPSLRKIREGILGNKENQKAGTFSIPSTKVKRLRDNAITILRNRVHDLVVRNNARSIYEKEVSAFESGSGKISKIYDSLKRSDVYHESSIEQAVGDLVWGKKSKLIGRDVSAYGTSYMCSKCHKSIYTLIARGDYEKKFEIKKIDSKKGSGKTSDKPRFQNTITFDIDGESVNGYMETERSKEVGDMVDGKTAQKAVKDYTRPPMKVFLDRHNGEKELKKLGIDKENFERTRGSQAIYICPFCNHIADADIQAAMWIALKGWLQLHTVAKGEKDKKPIFVDKSIQNGWGEEGDLKKKLTYLMRYAKEKGIPAIGLGSTNVKQKK